MNLSALLDSSPYRWELFRRIIWAHYCLAARTRKRSFLPDDASAGDSGRWIVLSMPTGHSTLEAALIGYQYQLDQVTKAMADIVLIVVRILLALPQSLEAPGGELHHRSACGTKTARVIAPYGSVPPLLPAPSAAHSEIRH